VSTTSSDGGSLDTARHQNELLRAEYARLRAELLRVSSLVAERMRTHYDIPAWLVLEWLDGALRKAAQP
jgi:hypothetical protein